MLLKSRFSWHPSFYTLKQEKTCNSAHQHNSLSKDTIDSFLHHREVGRAKDLSARPRKYTFLDTSSECDSSFSVLSAARNSFYCRYGWSHRILLCRCTLKDPGDTKEQWSEHAVWFRTCLYVHHVKGMSFIQKCRGLKAAQEFELCTDLI
jgi:hypothetical protein